MMNHTNNNNTSVKYQITDISVVLLPTPAAAAASSSSSPSVIPTRNYLHTTTTKTATTTSCSNSSSPSPQPHHPQPSCSSSAGSASKRRQQQQHQQQQQQLRPYVKSSFASSFVQPARSSTTTTPAARTLLQPHVLYTIESFSSCSSSSSSRRRSYEDFVALYHSLRRRYRHRYVVPPVPPQSSFQAEVELRLSSPTNTSGGGVGGGVSSVGAGSNNSSGAGSGSGTGVHSATAFQRRVQLEHFLTAVCEHPVLSCSPELSKFLLNDDDRADAEMSVDRTISNSTEDGLAARAGSPTIGINDELTDQDDDEDGGGQDNAQPQRQPQHTLQSEMVFTMEEERVLRGIVYEFYDSALASVRSAASSSSSTILFARYCKGMSEAVQELKTVVSLAWRDGRRSTPHFAPNTTPPPPPLAIPPPAPTTALPRVPSNASTSTDGVVSSILGASCRTSQDDLAAMLSVSMVAVQSHQQQTLHRHVAGLPCLATSGAKPRVGMRVHKFAPLSTLSGTIIALNDDNEHVVVAWGCSSTVVDEDDEDDYDDDDVTTSVESIHALRHGAPRDDTTRMLDRVSSTCPSFSLITTSDESENGEMLLLLRMTGALTYASSVIDALNAFIELTTEAMPAMHLAARLWLRTRRDSKHDDVRDELIVEELISKLVSSTHGQTRDACVLEECRRAHGVVSGLISHVFALHMKWVELTSLSSSANVPSSSSSGCIGLFGSNAETTNEEEELLNALLIEIGEL
eukprot:PhM_4_TR13250/c0_g1_i1/m.100920